MNRYKKLFSNTVILGFGTFGSKLLVFLLMPLYTAYLTTEQYGTAELITTTANLLIPIACVGITNAVFRFCAEKGSDQKAVFSSSIALLLIGLFAFAALSPLLLLIDYFTSYLWLIVLYVVLADLQAVCAQYIRAKDQTKLFAIQGMFNTGITILLNLLFLIVFNMGVTGYVLSVVLGNAITTLFLILKARLWQEFSFRSVKKNLIFEMLRYCVPLIPTTVCWLITDLSDRYMVTYYCGSSINGVYSAAYKIPTMINLLASIFLQAWQFSAVAESSDEDTCKKFYSDVFEGYSALILTGSAFLILISGFLTKLLLNSAYHGAAEFMPTLLCASAIEALVSFLATVYLVKKKSMHSLISASMGSVLNVILNFWLIPVLGGIGAAIATMTAYFAVFVFRLIDAPRMIRFRIGLGRLALSIAFLLGLSAIITLPQLPYRALIAILIVIAMLCVNAPALWKSCKTLLQKRRG